MATIPEIIQKAKHLLWIDEEGDTQEVEKIISDYSKKGYNGRLLENCQEGSDVRFTVTLADHPLFKIYEYFYNKYGDDDGMAFYYEWLWKAGISSPE